MIENYTITRSSWRGDTEIPMVRAAVTGIEVSTAQLTPIVTAVVLEDGTRVTTATGAFTIVSSNPAITNGVLAADDALRAEHLAAGLTAEMSLNTYTAAVAA